jgi:tyrosine-protein phosphatase SIW14
MVLLLMIAASAPLVKTYAEGGVPRFAVLADGLYRGGQPTEQGFQYLKQTGVKTIINLRAEDNSEAPLVEHLGMKYVWIPIPKVRPWSQISDDAIKQYFEVVNNRNNYPIFFHCHRGSDRTGFLAAAYRISEQQWEPKEAYEEARNIGMGWFFFSLKSQILGFQATSR